MFNCRVCAKTPFGIFFGYPDEDDSTFTETTQPKTRKKKKKGSSRGLSSLSSESSRSIGGFEEEIVIPPTEEERTDFIPRSPEELLILCKAWQNYTHPRAHDFWEDSDRINEILTKIARGVHRLCDPLLGNEKRCVFWHGPVSTVENFPIINAAKPGENHESQLYVIRVLVFFFCDDGSYLELDQKNQNTFPMLCEEPLCVNLSHVALD